MSACAASCSSNMHSSDTLTLRQPLHCVLVLLLISALGSDWGVLCGQLHWQASPLYTLVLVTAWCPALQLRLDLTDTFRPTYWV